MLYNVHKYKSYVGPTWSKQARSETHIQLIIRLISGSFPEEHFPNVVVPNSQIPQFLKCTFFRMYLFPNIRFPEYNKFCI